MYIILETIEALQKIGFTLYEARVYKALVSYPNTTGYEIAKNSKVPRGKVYEVLENLVERGSILLINEADRQIYQALPYKLLLSRYSKEVNDVVLMLNKNLEKLENQEDEKPFINLKNHKQIFVRIKEMCSEAKDSILITGFENELIHIKDELQSAEKKGVTIFLLEFGNFDLNLNNQYFHHISSLQEKQAKKYGRWFAVVKDTKECLLVQVKDNITTGVWTENMSMVLAITMWLQHDIMMHVMEKELGEDMAKQISKKANITLSKLWEVGIKEIFN